MTASAPAGSEAPLLQVANLHAFYGKSHVLHGVDLQIRKGEIVSLLGRNGVGRSTTARSIIGLVDCTGSVRFRGEEMVGRKAFEIANRGIGYVPENRDIFPTLTVEQNLLLGIKGGRTGGRWSIEETWRLFPQLKERANAPGGALSGGEQKQLEIGRALLLRPKVILIDEPSIGLSPLVVQDVFRLLRKLADQGTTVLMVEQNVKSALKISDEAIALESGRLVLQKPASELLADPNIERLFLGGAHAAAPAAATV